MTVVLGETVDNGDDDQMPDTSEGNNELHRYLRSKFQRLEKQIEKNRGDLEANIREARQEVVHSEMNLEQKINNHERLIMGDGVADGVMGRIKTLEHSTSRMADLKEQITDLRGELRYWSRWLVATLLTVSLGLIGTILTMIVTHLWK